MENIKFTLKPLSKQTRNPSFPVRKRKKKMATLQLTNPNELMISSPSIPTPFQHKSLPFRECFSQRKSSNYSQKRHRFGVVSCSFTPMESAKIKVVGVGGGGNNAVNCMIGSSLHVGFR